MEGFLSAHVYVSPTIGIIFKYVALAVRLPTESNFPRSQAFQWQIQDFPEVGAPTPQGGANTRFCQNFPKNCMKLKEFGPGGGALAPP